MPYDGKADRLGDLIARGGGSLVASIYSDDERWIGELVPHAGAWSGRLYLGSKKMAEQALGSGLAMPQSKHGGPGRAGGGEELGAARGLYPELRQVLLWPLRLMPVRRAGAEARVPPWQVLRELGETSPWREVVDEYTGEEGAFHERHYTEFVAFLPYVQRFLYGEGRKRAGAGDDARTGSPMRVFRREDVVQVRVAARPGEALLRLDVVHVDLYFFYDVDVVMLNVEVRADGLTLAQTQELLYRFGRGYPPGWDARGQALHCMHGVEWLGADGRVLARSDAQDRATFLAHVCEHRAPRLSAHWAWLLRPLVPDHSEEAGALRFRQIEYYRMPMMAWLALDEPRDLTRNDFIRLGLVTGVGGSGGGENAAPYA